VNLLYGMKNKCLSLAALNEQEEQALADMGLCQN